MVVTGVVGAVVASGGTRGPVSRGCCLDSRHSCRGHETVQPRRASQDLVFENGGSCVSTSRDLLQEESITLSGSTHILPGNYRLAQRSVPRAASGGLAPKWRNSGMGWREHRPHSGRRRGSIGTDLAQGATDRRRDSTNFGASSITSGAAHMPTPPTSWLIPTERAAPPTSWAVLPIPFTLGGSADAVEGVRRPLPTK